jgi:hypothetical protein
VDAQAARPPARPEDPHAVEHPRQGCAVPHEALAHLPLRRVHRRLAALEQRAPERRRGMPIAALRITSYRIVALRVASRRLVTGRLALSEGMS